MSGRGRGVEPDLVPESFQGARSAALVWFWEPQEQRQARAGASLDLHRQGRQLASSAKGWRLWSLSEGWRDRARSVSGAAVVGCPWASPGKQGCRIGCLESSRKGGQLVASLFQCWRFLWAVLFPKSFRLIAP